MKVIVLLLWLTTAVLAAPSPVAIQLDKRSGFAPLNIRAKITVEPHEDNRMVCLVADGGQYRSSCWEHVGVKAPVTQWVELKRLQEGAYVVTVAVQRVGGEVETAMVTVCVLGPNTGLEACR